MQTVAWLFRSVIQLSGERTKSGLLDVDQALRLIEQRLPILSRNKFQARIADALALKGSHDDTRALPRRFWGRVLIRTRLAVGFTAPRRVLKRGS